MSLRPVDEDLLEDLCREIALEHSGFLYVNKAKDEIRSKYENSDTGLLKADSVTGREINAALETIANDEFNEFERLRTGVYYYNPFATGNDDEIAADLTNLFGQRLVVTSEELRSRFDIAFDDIDTFVNELASKDLVRRIAAGERDYFTIGPRLKEQTGEAGVDARLRQKSSYGKISHDQLERVINVEATQDVIRYLESQDFIVDMDGEYLVESAMDEFGAHLAGDIEDDIESEFERWNYVLPAGEFRQITRNALSERSDVLGHIGSADAELLDHVESALESQLGLERDRSMVVQTEAFDSVIDQRAEQVRSRVSDDGGDLVTESDFVEAGHDRIADLQVTNATESNEYFRRELRERYSDLIESEFTAA